MISFSSEQRRIEGMVNLGTLEVFFESQVWATHSDKVLLDALGSVALSGQLPVSAMNIEKVGSTVLESFARYQIPRTTVTQKPIPSYSPFDRIAIINMDDYAAGYSADCRVSGLP